MTPDIATAQRSSIQTHLSSISTCTMPPILVVIDAVETTSHLLATSTLSPLLELREVHHPHHHSVEHENFPRGRLHGGYDAKDAAAAQSRLNFGLSSGRVRRWIGETSTSHPRRVTASRDVADARLNMPIKVSFSPHPIPPNLGRLRIRQRTTNRNLQR
ncbi:hypothetical protein ZWY2020_033415 [Hordeum vulgare]|nr:hypothetical protein ZWY2020_033415 [Hordeum vulgare]